jgi:hypothetical protein
VVVRSTLLASVVKPTDGMTSKHSERELSWPGRSRHSARPARGCGINGICLPLRFGPPLTCPGGDADPSGGRYGAIRFSLGRTTTAEEIDDVLDGLKAVLCVTPCRSQRATFTNRLIAVRGPRLWSFREPSAAAKASKPLSVLLRWARH